LHDWLGHRVLELAGPHDVTPVSVAAELARALECPVRTEVVPRDKWDALFRSQGVRDPAARMRMLDGLDQGWIRFQEPQRVVRGQADLRSVLQSLSQGFRASRT
jgi:hypothetical protein